MARMIPVVVFTPAYKSNVPVVTICWLVVALSTVPEIVPPPTAVLTNGIASSVWAPLLAAPTMLADV